MDHQSAMMNDGGPFHLPEIWQFPVGGGAASYNLPASLSGVNQSRDHHASVDDPMVVDQRTNQNAGGGTRKRREEDESAKAVSTSGNNNGNANGVSECDNKRLKASGSNENRDSKAPGETNSGKAGEQTGKPAEPPKDYIHVRARRGQATDSHSLAERARREKISERMKILQDLVPGCNKVIGKALVLDEIINYIQSLQRQVEFLSMKLEAVNSRMTPSIEGFPSKDYGQQAFDSTGMAFGSQATREYARGTSPDWLHMQIGGSFERTT